jgi:phosphoribosylamine-glycine ligase
VEAGAIQRYCERWKALRRPGNPGIAQDATLVPLDATDHGAVVAFCTLEQIALVVVGPEAPLVDGLADSLRAEGIPVFGPSKAAAQLEGSRALPRICASARTFPPPVMCVCRRAMTLWRLWNALARPWSSRPTVWPPARA